MKHLYIATLVAGLLMAPSIAVAQAGTAQRPTTSSAPQKQAQAVVPAPGTALPGDMPDARETRNRLNDIFSQLPPSVREVLRIDPTLLSRADYMATYPVLAAFLVQHPEIAHNPAYFIGERQFNGGYGNDSASRRYDALNRAIENMLTILVVGTIVGGILFLARTIVEHRRWQRAMRAQSELQTKLIDRFSSSDDLIAYLQSPAGKMLAEPPVLGKAAARPMSAPLSRIFWSLQSGVVAGALGLGLIVVGRGLATDEFGDLLFGMGIIVLAIGLGFAASAAISFLLSQRLGLVQPLSARYGDEAPGP